MTKLFGTDGIRGIAGEDLNSELALKVGEATATILRKKNNNQVVVLVGRDTRVSGEVLSYSLITGLMNKGVTVIDLGIIPTPAISYLLKEYKASAGIMISASHNPYEYNGIKIFNNEGFKLSDELEEEIEDYILNNKDEFVPGAGEYKKSNTLFNDYIDFLRKQCNFNKKYRIVIDCANGAASLTAPKVFSDLGMNVIFINTDYNGFNINKDCGSTHIESLKSAVKFYKADLGVAFDGDADRCLMVSNDGELVDGDQIIAIAAKDLKSSRKLSNNTIVGTVMSNLGLKKFCEKENINFESTKVGDRYVLEEMEQNGYSIGGEQSGHIIFRNIANTGDGELTAINIINIMDKEQKSLKELASVMKKYPQVIVNVNVSKEEKNNLLSNYSLINAVEKVKSELGEEGRVLVRPSGTENLIRVMVEGLDTEDITNKANYIASFLNQEQKLQLKK